MLDDVLDVPQAFLCQQSGRYTGFCATARIHPFDVRPSHAHQSPAGDMAGDGDSLAYVLSTEAKQHASGQGAPDGTVERRGVPPVSSSATGLIHSASRTIPAYPATRATSNSRPETVRSSRRYSVMAMAAGTTQA